LEDQRSLPELIEVVQQRLLEARRGNRQAVLDDGALADAASLLKVASAVKPGVLDVLPTTLLGLLHWFRYLEQPDGRGRQDLYEAVGYFNLLIEITPEFVPEPARQWLAGGRNGPWARAQRASEELDRLTRQDDQPALDAAIDTLDAAVAAIPSGHPELADMLINLASGHGLRYERRGDLADLDRSVTIVRRALTTVPPVRDRRVALSNLGVLLVNRFQHTGTRDDIDESIQVLREAARTPASDPRTEAQSLTNLSLALQTRFEVTGASVDLVDAVTAARQATRVGGVDDADRPLLFNNLALVLSGQFRNTDDIDRLDEAVAAARRAAALVPPEHSERPLILNNLSAALRARYERPYGTRDAENAVEADLDEAVRVAREAVRATPAGRAKRSRLLGGLLLALRARYRRTGDSADLDEAIFVGRWAIDSVPPDHPDLAMLLWNIGVVLMERFHRTSDRRDVDETLHNWTTAADIRTAPAAHRLRAARHSAATTAALGTPSTAVQAYATALDLLELVAWRGISRTDQLRLLQAEASGLATDAASAAVAAAAPDSAVLRLEQGRAVLWSQLLATRSDLSRLEHVNDDLARQLLACRAQLDQLALDGLDAPWLAPPEPSPVT
jgi:tetratricopeptide (TPR) repeat protein